MFVRTTSPLFAVVGPIVAAGAALVRWLVQGSGNLYTDLSRGRYVPDPDLGWRLIEPGPVWLGVDSIVALAAIIPAMGIALWLIHRREQRTHTPWMIARGLLWGVSVLVLAVPAAAAASGLGPDGGRDAPPGSLVSAPTSGVSGHLDAPPGRYAVVPRAGSAVVAVLDAGGETFEARFAGDLAGALRFDPGDLTQPMSARFTAAAASVDTGIELRSKHAREYLQVERYPRIGFRLERVIAAGPQDGGIAFRADGIIELMGREHRTPINGTLRVADASARGRLGTTGPTLLVNASFSLDLAKTAMGNDGTFDHDLITLHASLVMTHSAKEPKP